MDFDPKEAEMKYCGIDLHSNNSVVVVSDEEDRIVFSKRLPNDLAQILFTLEPHQHELAGVVIESTYNWYWLVDGPYVVQGLFATPLSPLHYPLQPCTDRGRILLNNFIRGLQHI